MEGWKSSEALLRNICDLSGPNQHSTNGTKTSVASCSIRDRQAVQSSKLVNSRLSTGSKPQERFFGLGEQMGKVIYLTGAPATGKSSLCAALGERISNLEFYSYSTLLRDIVNQRMRTEIDESGIREKSAQVVTRADVTETDRRLIDEITAKRHDRHLIIDSHPVTKEAYGFRITPFTIDQLKQLAPDIIVCAYAPSPVIADRIRANPAGRPLPEDSDIALHVQLQASLAAQYGFQLDRPCYLLDTNASKDAVLQRFLEITKLS